MKVVGIGGGHGLAATLQAARRYAEDIVAVVTVADDGGSSGRLTRELGIPPPGDIRNCLVALANDRELAALYQHRFQQGALTGHTVGNLLIAALTERTGSFAEAVQRAGRLLEAEGRVFPATSALVELHALIDGEEVKGQVAVAQAEGPIEAVYLAPSDPEAHPEAVRAILEADQIVLGPGSLFTSLIATLLVPGIRTALQQTKGRRIFVCNTRAQKGETEGLDAAAHLGALLAHAGAWSVDTVVVQDPVHPTEGIPTGGDGDFEGIPVVRADVASPSGGHDPDRLADVLVTLA
jgi:uncharacterized cofD-like protein